MSGFDGPLLLALDAGTIAQIVIIAFMVIAGLVSAVSGMAKNAAPPPRRPPQGGGGNREVDDFLKKVAQSQARGGSPPRTSPPPPRPQPQRQAASRPSAPSLSRPTAQPARSAPATRPAPARPVIQAEIVQAEIVPEGITRGSSVAEHVRQHLDTQSFERREANLGQVDEEVALLNAHVQQVFDHQVGTLTRSADASTAGQAAASPLAAMLADPNQLRQAFILQEVLKRPDFDR